jgi:hypothetical protein
MTSQHPQRPQQTFTDPGLFTELMGWALDDSHVSAECMVAVYAAMERERVRGASRKSPIFSRARRYVGK